MGLLRSDLFRRQCDKGVLVSVFCSESRTSEWSDHAESIIEAFCADGMIEEETRIWSILA